MGFYVNNDKMKGSYVYTVESVRGMEGSTVHYTTTELENAISYAAALTKKEYDEYVSWMKNSRVIENGVDYDDPNIYVLIGAEDLEEYVDRKVFEATYKKDLKMDEIKRQFNIDNAALLDRITTRKLKFLLRKLNLDSVIQSLTEAKQSVDEYLSEQD